ncbi:respiratory chain complex I subunit 1 family protein [Haliovirga abyssi]|uniref:NADH dehydrogenase n=1 Tax=Haliovirga abyssi TaxID=2996794 RepID=A0AAU9DLB4_9FUSO|nr:complex I subunit 1 family protein [Haliovirga abyssi]BDU50727.1 NADH dehydrogenase [Haliovirga abyssi]
MNYMGFIIGFGLLLFAFAWQVSLDGIQRKITARIHKRFGPPWYQTFLDIFKAMSKEPISHGWIYDFGVMMALGGTMATLIFMPVAGIISFDNMDNFFVITYLLAIGSLGMAMSAVGSGNPWASIGVMRALTQMVGYELPFIITVMTIIFGFKTSSISTIAHLQQGGFLYWNMFRFPLGGIVAFVSLMGMLGKKPFDTPIAPAEIASGPLVEYGGKHLAMLILQHEFSTFIEVSLFVNLFLGGGPTIIAFLTKYFLVYTLTTMIATAVGRFKIDDLIKFYYKVPLAMAVVQALVVVFTGLGVTIWF